MTITALQFTTLNIHNQIKGVTEMKRAKRWMECSNCEAVEFVECEADGWKCPYCGTTNESPPNAAPGEICGDGTWACWNCHLGFDAQTCPGEIYEDRDTKCERWIRCNS